MYKSISELAQINPGNSLPSGVRPMDDVSFIPMSDVSESGEWTGRQVRSLRSVSSGFTSFSDNDVLVAKITPCFENGKGTHVNISGAVVAKNAPNKAQAVKLLEFLVSPKAQQMYAQSNFEYPVRKGVSIDPVIAQSISEITPDNTSLVDIARNRQKASQLIDKVGFDR